MGRRGVIYIYLYTFGMSLLQKGHSFRLHKTLILVEHSKQTGWSQTPTEHISKFLQHTTHSLSLKFGDSVSDILAILQNVADVWKWNKTTYIAKIWQSDTQTRNVVNRDIFDTDYMSDLRYVEREIRELTLIKHIRNKYIKPQKFSR